MHGHRKAHVAQEGRVDAVPADGGTEPDDAWHEDQDE